MAIMYDWVCEMGHVFEEMAESGAKEIMCPYCNNVDNGDDSGYGGPDRSYSRQSLDIAYNFADKLRKGNERGGPSLNAHRVMLATPAWQQKSSTTLGIVVHQDAQGNIRHPAHPDAPVPAGFEKVQVDSLHHARQIERKVNAQNAALAEDKAYGERIEADAKAKAAEDDTLARMGDMTPQGRQFAEYAMRKAREKREEKSTRADPGDAGFEALNYDKSNRGDYRDESSNWNKVQE